MSDFVDRIKKQAANARWKLFSSHNFESEVEQAFQQAKENLDSASKTGRLQAIVYDLTTSDLHPAVIAMAGDPMENCQILQMLGHSFDESLSGVALGLYNRWATDPETKSIPMDLHFLGEHVGEAHRLSACLVVRVLR